MRLYSAVPVLLALVGCRNDYDITPKAVEPPSFTVTSPSYGAFLGDADILISGTASPAGTALDINGVTVISDEDGAFEMRLPVGGPCRVVDSPAGEQRAGGEHRGAPPQPSAVHERRPSAWRCSGGALPGPCDTPDIVADFPNPCA